MAAPARADLPEAPGGKSSSAGTWAKSVFKAQESSAAYMDAISEAGINSETHTAEMGRNLNQIIQIYTLGGGTTAALAGLSEEEQKIADETFGRGALGAVNDGLVALYTPPASAQSYVADLMESAHIIPQAHAQGLGFASLDPILEGWKQFRNIAYLFFVVIFLVIGFLIMFRVQVGQAAITAQQAIPSILTALVFVTFSYAIAGFLIDLMYLLMYMIAGLFGEGAEIIDLNIFQIAGRLFIGSWGDAQNGVEQLMEDFLNQGFVADALSFITSMVAATIVGVAIVIGVFKTFVELLKSYISIILQIIFSPIILMFGAIPGQNPFWGWIKNIFGNLLLWPVFLLVMIVERILTSPLRDLTNAEANAAFGGGFMPPFMMGQGQAAIFPVLVGVGILLIIPDIMKQVKEKMGIKDGIFGDLTKSAWGNIQGATPIGAKGFTSAAGGIGGATVGLIKGIGDSKGQANMRDRLRDIGKSVIQTSGTGASLGNKVGSKISSGLGGKTTKGFGIVENAIDAAANYNSTENIVKRINEGNGDTVKELAGYYYGEFLGDEKQKAITNAKANAKMAETKQARINNRYSSKK
jgi:hypothetical protein